MNAFNLEQLRTFVDVASCGSFSATALRHNVSQPAVSLQVKQLEKRLGVILIERIGRKAIPTAAGLELLEHAVRINGEVSAALEAMARHASGRLGLVRLGAESTICLYVLPQVLRDLRLRMPDLEITVTTGGTRDIVAAVEDNALDIALVCMPASGRNLAVEIVLEDEFILVAPPDMNQTDAEAEAILRNVPLIQLERSNSPQHSVDRWLVDNALEPRRVMSVGCVETIKEMVSAGLGCAILPGMAMRNPAGPFVMRQLTPRLHRHFALVLRKDKVLRRGLRELARALGGGQASASAGSESGVFL